MFALLHDSRATETTMHLTTVNGLACHTRLIPAPQGAPFLAFSNSLGTDFRIWDAVSERLAGRCAMLFYDSRGHGLSAIGETPYRIETLAADLAALIEQAARGPAIVVGLSVGGMIAQQLAAARPDLVRALVLCDTAHRIGTDELWNSRIATVKTKGIAAMSDAILERWFTPAFRSPGNPLFAGCRAMLERQPAEGYAATCAALRDADLTHSSARLAVPTQLVGGDQDGSTPPDLVRQTAALIPGARFELIENCAHIPCVEQPERLAALISGFVAEVMR